MAIKVKHDGGASSAFAAAAAGGAGKRRAQQSVEMMKSEAQQSMSDNQITAQLAAASMRGGGGGGGGGGGHAPSLLSAPAGSVQNAPLISAPNGAGGPMSTPFNNAKHQAAADRRHAEMAEAADKRLAERQEAADERRAQMAEEADFRRDALSYNAEVRKRIMNDVFPSPAGSQALPARPGTARMPTQGEVDAALGRVLEGARRKEAALRGLPGTAAPAASRRSNVTFTGSGVPGGDDATAGQMSRLQEVLAASRDADGNIREGWGDIYKFADEQVRNIYAQGIGYRGKDGDAKAYDRPPSGDGNNRALGYFIESTDGGAAPGGAPPAAQPQSAPPARRGTFRIATKDGRHSIEGSGDVFNETTIMSDGEKRVEAGRLSDIPLNYAPGMEPATNGDAPVTGGGTDGRPENGNAPAAGTGQQPAAKPAEAPAPENPAPENPAQPDGGFDVAAARKRIEVLKRSGSYDDRREIRRLKSQIKEAERPQKELSKGKDAAERQLEIMRAHPSHYSASEFEKAEERLRKATEAYNAFVGG